MKEHRRNAPNILKVPASKYLSKIRVGRNLREKINLPVSQKDLQCKDVSEMSHLGVFVHHPAQAAGIWSRVVPLLLLELEIQNNHLYHLYVFVFNDTACNN